MSSAKARADPDPTFAKKSKRLVSYTLCPKPYPMS